jgi:KDO2-lipid IV(A) lauroyltransferase
LAARRSALRDRLEYLLVMVVVNGSSLLPGRLVLAAARALAWMLFRLARRRTRHTALRVARCLDLDAEDPRVMQVVAGSWRTLLLNIFEPPLVERALEREGALQRHLVVEGAEHLEQALQSGRGVLVCTAHFGAWESIAIFSAHRFTALWAMARQLDNPLLERFLLERRLRCTRGSIPKEGGGLKLARVMKAGEPLGLLLDQNAGQQGVILDFLGVPSSHHKAAGVMSRRFGALAVPVYLLREPGHLRYRMVVEPPVTADPDLGEEQAVVEVTRRISRSLEARVRAHPEQWLWLHDRWRHALHVLSVSGGAGGPGDVTAATAVQGTNRG